MNLKKIKKILKEFWENIKDIIFDRDDPDYFEDHDGVRRKMWE